MSGSDAARATERLREAAVGLGVEPGYWDVRGEYHEAGVDALLGVLRVLGADAANPEGAPAAVADLFDRVGPELTDPVVVWGDGPLRGAVVVDDRCRHVEVEVRLASGEERAVRLAVEDLPAVAAVPGIGPRPRRGQQLRSFTLPGPWPTGYHRLAVERDGETVVADVLVAPVRVAALRPDERLWGLLAPVYALAGGTGIGAHVGNLAVAARAIDAVGGKIIATLPLLAAYLGEPFDPSPYAPVSRRHWNELFVDLAALPEVAAVPRAAENLAGLSSFGHAANVRAKAFDYRHQAGYVRGVLDQVVAGRDGWPAGLADGFATFLAERPDVTDYARFRAFAEARGAGWHEWPERQRSGKIADADVDPDVVALHCFAQYAMGRDLAALHRDLDARGQRLYLDLPVGAHGDGYDTWQAVDAFAWGAAAGAPPDDFFAEGQNWGFPPLLPHTPGHQALWHVREVVRHHMDVAGILRLDHAMSLERLFWVPDGMGARDGVYVRYPREALLAVLAIESADTGCVVVGEDLGTVTDSVRDAMAQHDLLGMYVVEFSQPSWPGAPPEPPRAAQLASIDTHDTPTLAGWLRATDVDRRQAAGQLGDDEADEARAERAAQVDNLLRFLVMRGNAPRGVRPDDDAMVLEGLLRFLGDSEARAVLLAVDDLVAEQNPQNVPGTTVDRPNWVQRVRLGAEDLATDPGIVALLQVLQDCRLGSHLEARAAAAREDPAQRR
jgi:4-alpha-glucanotransferase